MGERLIAFNHPESTAIELRCNQLGEKWEMVNEVVEERMGMMFLAVNFYSKQDKVQYTHMLTHVCVYIKQYFTESKCSSICPDYT